MISKKALALLGLFQFAAALLSMAVAYKFFGYHHSYIHLIAPAIWVPIAIYLNSLPRPLWMYIALAVGLIIPLAMIVFWLRALDGVYGQI
jgi:hypothetical protein